MKGRQFRYLDTNILIRVFARDDLEKLDRTTELLRRVESGDETIETSPVVIFEVVYTLDRYYKLPRQEIREQLTNLLQFAGLRIADRQVCIDALALYESINISFADAYLATQMRHRGITEIYSWDRDFDRIEGISRVEP